MTLEVSSPSFSADGPIPAQFTGDGRDISPALSWSNLPSATAEVALIVDDPDAPTPDPWVHWVIYKIPADTGGLSEAIAKTIEPPDPTKAVQGRNSWGKIGYGGPAPPRGHGLHHYRFRLYAVDARLNLAPGLDKRALLAAMEGHIIGEGEVVGTFQR